MAEASSAAANKERKILVAVDESEESMYALTWCLNNIVSNHSEDTLLILLYAKPPPVARYTALDATAYMFSSDMMIATMETYSNEVAASIVEKAKNICRKIVEDVKVETRVERGVAREVICQMVEKLCVDLLVMGSHGYGAIKRAFVGSVSNHCAQCVKCPVLVVKRSKSPIGSK